MVVYCATNSHNGKKYVGITGQSLPRRISEHRGRMLRGDRQHKFYLALRKYGFDAFTWDILAETNSEQELKNLEIAFIEQFGSYRAGYNSTPGGDMVSPETKQLLSNIHKGRTVTWGEKTRQTRLANGSYYGHNGTKGSAHPRSKSYFVLTPDGSEIQIKGLRQFCRENQLSHNLMLSVANGRQTQHKGFKCAYHIAEPSTTIPEGSTPQAIGGGNGEHP